MLCTCYCVQLTDGFLYVGQTALAPTERFAQHEAGIKSGHFKGKLPVRLRPDLVPVRWEPRMDAEDREMAEASRLRRLGHQVLGGH